MYVKIHFLVNLSEEIFWFIFYLFTFWMEGNHWPSWSVIEMTLGVLCKSCCVVLAYCVVSDSVMLMCCCCVVSLWFMSPMWFWCCLSAMFAGRTFCPGRRTQRFALPSLRLSRSRSQGQLHLEFGAVHQSASYEALDLHVWLPAGFC